MKILNKFYDIICYIITDIYLLIINIVDNIRHKHREVIDSFFNIVILRPKKINIAFRIVYNCKANDINLVI